MGRRISESKKGQKPAQTTIDNSIKARKGKLSWNKGLEGCYVHSDETKKKMSETRTGHLTSDGTRRKISNSNRGKKRTPEMNEANRERNLNKMWITNPLIEKNKMIKKWDLDLWQSQGWIPGKGHYPKTT